MIVSPYATERTLAQLAGRAEREALQNYNGKPYRTKAQKAQASRDARKDKDGAYRSSVPVSYHPKPK